MRTNALSMEHTEAAHGTTRPAYGTKSQRKLIFPKLGNKIWWCLFGANNARRGRSTFVFRTFVHVLHMLGVARSFIENPGWPQPANGNGWKWKKHARHISRACFWRSYRACNATPLSSLGGGEAAHTLTMRLENVSGGTGLDSTKWENSCHTKCNHFM